MRIETKFEIGERVWTVEKDNIAVDVASGIISEIFVEEDGKINYFFNEWCCKYSEEQVVKYDDIEGLVEKIRLIDNQIKEAKEGR